MIEFFNEMYAFITSGIYDFVVEVYAWLIIKITAFQLQAAMASIEFAWDIAREIITQLNISSEMQSALSQLPPDIVDKLNFFNVINGLNLMLNALVTRFVMRFI
jgi:hypothetical protein